MGHEMNVYCDFCNKRNWCAHRQYMKYTLGIEFGYCAAGEYESNTCSYPIVKELPVVDRDGVVVILDNKES